ncbi:MFS general substrate transporter [Meredithblackwellia eburnea MCA 4105]
MTTPTPTVYRKPYVEYEDPAKPQQTQLENAGGSAGSSTTPPAHANSKVEVFLALLALAMSFGSQLGVGSNMAPSILPQIAAAFGSDAVPLQAWTSAGWLLSTCVAFTVAGRLSDIFGRFYIITGSNLLAIAGFAICAFTSNFSVYIGGIIILGFAGGFAQTATAAASEIVPNKWRPAAIAFLELSIAPTGFLAGSTFSHLIVANTTYKWVFRLGMILCGVAFFLCLAFYRPPSNPMHDGRTKMARFLDLDFLGIFLFSSGMGVFLMGVVWAGGQYPAKDLHVILPIVLGLVTLGAFAGWQIKMGDRAIVPPRLFRGRTRSFTLPVIVHFVAGTVFFSQIALWPQQSGMFYTDSLIGVGILGLPPGVAVFVGGCLVGLFIPKLGPTNRQLQIATVMIVTATASMAALTPTSKAGAIACVVLANFPFHLIVNLCFLTVQFASDPEDLGIAVGLCGTGRSVGGSVGVSIYTTILQSRIPKVVPGRIAAAAVGAGLGSNVVSEVVAGLMAGNVAAVGTLSGVTPAILKELVTAMNNGYQKCFSTVYLSTLGFGICGIIASFFVIDIHNFFTDDVAVSLGQKDEGQAEGQLNEKGSV